MFRLILEVFRLYSRNISTLFSKCFDFILVTFRLYSRSFDFILEILRLNLRFFFFYVALKRRRSRACCPKWLIFSTFFRSSHWTMFWSPSSPCTLSSPPWTGFVTWGLVLLDTGETLQYPPPPILIGLLIKHLMLVLVLLFWILMIQFGHLVCVGKI